jgi:hypothetical protein
MPIPSSPERGCLAIVIDVVFPEATPALAQVLLLPCFWNGHAFLARHSTHAAVCFHPSCRMRQQPKVSHSRPTTSHVLSLHLRRFAGLTGQEEEVVSRPVSELEMQVIRTIISFSTLTTDSTGAIRTRHRRRSRKLCHTRRRGRGGRA